MEGASIKWAPLTSESFLLQTCYNGFNPDTFSTPQTPSQCVYFAGHTETTFSVRYNRTLKVVKLDRSYFDEAIPREGDSSLDIDLLDWFARNHERVMEYLSPREAQQDKHHSCLSKAITPPNCHYLSQHHHLRRSRHCPDVRDGLVTFPEDGVSEHYGDADADIETGGLDEWGNGLAGAGHNFAALSLSYRLPGNIVDLVCLGRATREQFWVLDGVLYRQMHVVTDGDRREVFVKLSFCLYRARQGAQVLYKAFELLDKAVGQIKELQDCGLPNDTMEYHTSKDWIALLAFIGLMREIRWPNTAEVLAGVKYSSARFPEGSALGEGGYHGDILHVLGVRPGTTDEIEALPYVMESIE